MDYKSTDTHVLVIFYAATVGIQQMHVFYVRPRMPPKEINKFFDTFYVATE